MTGGMITTVAKEIMGRPDAHLAKLEALDDEHDGFDGVRIELVDAPLVTAGPNIGRPNWKKATNRQVRLISNDTLAAAADAWSERTGLCSTCTGEGRTFNSWHRDEGSTFKPCRSCNGTGSADGVTVSATRNTVMFEPAAAAKAAT